MAISFNQVDSSGKYSLNEGGSYTLIYDVHDTSVVLGPVRARFAILDHLGIQYGSTYSDPVSGDYDNNAYLIDVDTSKVSDNGFQRTALLSYQYMGTNPNPLLQPLRYSGGSSPGFERVVWRDSQGSPIQNSAGDQYAQPVTVPGYIANFGISKYFSSIPFYLDNFVDSVCADGFLGRSAKTVKLIDWSYNGPTYHPVYGSYVDVSATFSVNPEGWDLLILDQGLKQIGDDGKLAPILYKGSEITEPANLNGAGKVLSAGPAVFRRHTVNYVIPWGGLGFV